MKTNAWKVSVGKNSTEDFFFFFQDITAEEERHARQAAAMAAFCAAEQDEAAATFGKEAADAAVDRMKRRLEALKAVQARAFIVIAFY